jgi:hypothetical protein
MRMFVPMPFIGPYLQGQAAMQFAPAMQSAMNQMYDVNRANQSAMLQRRRMDNELLAAILPYYLRAEAIKALLGGQSGTQHRLPPSLTSNIGQAIRFQ